MLAQRTQQMENVPRRKSRRIRGLAPHIDVPPPKAVFLPPELKIAVLAQLDKLDLKSARLVSKEWSVLATEPLFDRVYMSCRAKDIEIFQNITRHPTISTSIRELVYDGSLFKADMGVEEYFHGVYDEVSWIALQLEPGTHFNSADVQINKFVQDCKEHKISSEIYKTHMMDTFVVEGYQKYRECSSFEHHYMETASHFDDLCKGLLCLTNLRAVELSNTIWHYEPNEHKPNTLQGPYSGSPLCRSWNPFHLRPRRWRMLPDANGRFVIWAHFHMLTAAIAQARKNISSLQIPTDGIVGGLPLQVLMKSNLDDSQLWHFMTAYSGLSCLDIHITTNILDRRDALTVLPELLAHTWGLKRLALHLGKGVGHRLPREGVSEGVSKYYRYDEIFPANGFWPKLTELTISGLAIGGWDLMTLILGRTKVERLDLCGIDLLDGAWEGVVTGMKSLSRLTQLSMHGEFKHCGGAVFRHRLRNDEHLDEIFLLAIEVYVIYGGRHPCLTSESDPDDADRWYIDLMPEKVFSDWMVTARQCGLDVNEFQRLRKQYYCAKSLVSTNPASAPAPSPSPAADSEDQRPD